jgi:hypothetical protein
LSLLPYNFFDEETLHSRVFLSLSVSLEAKNCAMLDAVLPLSGEVSELSQSVQAAATKNVCEELGKVKTSDDLKAVIKLEKV